MLCQWAKRIRRAAKDKEKLLVCLFEKRSKNPSIGGFFKIGCMKEIIS
jgi:hypothetical protein